MNSIIEAIDKEASSLPPEFQREVLDFIGYLHTKRERKSDPAWLERAWGALLIFLTGSSRSPLMFRDNKVLNKTVYKVANLKRYLLRALFISLLSLPLLFLH